VGAAERRRNNYAQGIAPLRWISSVGDGRRAENPAVSEEISVQTRMVRSVLLSGAGELEAAMRVQDVMSARVKTVAAHAAAEDAWNVMQFNRIHHLVVISDGRVAGILSDRDAGGRRGAPVRLDRTVADLMTSPAVTVTPATTVRQAANLMRGRSIGCLVVVRSGRPIGIVTVSDLLELVGRGLDRGAAPASRRGLSHRAPHRKSKGAVAAW
jgi:acetoin utilization protein AcuB